MKHITPICLTILLAATAAPARANEMFVQDEYYVTTSLGSHHFGVRDNGERYNEFNPGIGFEAAQKPFAHIWGMPVRTSLSAGYYDNSIDKPSFYLVGGLETCKPFTPDFAACGGIQAGGVTGYFYNITPAAIGYAKVQYDTAFAKLGLIPPVQSDDGDVPATLLFQIGYKFY